MNSKRYSDDCDLSLSEPARINEMPGSDELHHLTAQQQLLALQRAEISPVELTEHYLARIERTKYRGRPGPHMRPHRKENLIFLGALKRH